MKKIIKTNMAILILSAFLAILILLAQEPPRPAVGGIAERFKQLDRDGDGKITREEAPQLPMFDQWDANKDGAVTLEEVTTFYTNRRAAGKGNDTRPATSAKPVGDSKPKAPATDGFVPDAPFVGEVNGSYIDPEFNEATCQVVFQDMENRVWIGDIDPATGLFKTATGRDHLMDENITIIFDRPPQGRKFSTNGPEWTRDADGQHCVVYTKADQNGILQQWMARLVDGKS
ncbi:MAG: EF-hand domain-containing protein, partial [Acidobacteria bacterium]|nr:EF-hand domain-containing protein [Acidobacteriota bacterium]